MIFQFLESGPRMKFSTALLVGTVVLAGALAMKTLQLGRELADQIQRSSRELSEAEVINRGLLDGIQTLQPPPYSLAGTDAASGEGSARGAIDSLVLYLFASDCPFSSKNVPFLNGVHAARVPVVGIAPEERLPSIRGFARSSKAQFPFLVAPTGSVLEILPRGRVPLTAVFIHGKLMNLWLGELSEDRQNQLKVQLGI